MIAETARLRSDLAEISMPDELVVGLTQLTSHRTDLMGDWVAAITRLRALLGAIFPALEAAFDYSNRTPLILVAGMCTPAEIRAAGIDGLTTYLSENGAWRKGIDQTARTALAAAAAQTIALPGEADTAMLIKRVARKLLDLDREIKDTDKLIAERFRTHPWARTIESLPGMGPGLGAEFIAVTGGGPGHPPPRAGWRPMPDWCRYHEIPAEFPATCTDRNGTTGDCGGCSTWPPCPACAPKARRGGSTTANVANGSSIPKRSEALARRLVDVLWALLRDGREFTFDTPKPAAAAA